MKNANLRDQFFLHNQEIVEEMIARLDIQAKDTVLEIGAGNGVLTKEIASQVRVIAVEIDDRYRQDLAKIDNTVLFIGDALEVIKKPNLKFNKIIGSLPSSIIEPLFKILPKINFDWAVFLVPLRFVSKLKQKDYFDLTLIAKVDRHSFSPVPKTNWALVKVLKKRILSEEEFLKRYQIEHPLAKAENARREGLIAYYKTQGKKLTKNQARKILKA